jgi:Na+/proline symporter
LVAIVFELIFEKLGIRVPFVVTVLITIALIWLYTFKGGIKTIIWTDTLQTVMMISAVVITIIYINTEMGFGFREMATAIIDSSYSKIWVWNDWQSSQLFVKQFLSGAFITIVMTGLDQDMMQKNLSIRTLKEAQKNMYWYGSAFLPINLLFLSLGALLFIYIQHLGIAMPQRADDLYPMLALGGYLPATVGIVFILGLVAAAYSSADSTLASVTTSFSVDILGVEKMDAIKAK